MKFFSLFLFLLIFMGCSKLPPIDEQKLNASIYTEYDRDAYGLPYFSHKIKESKLKKNCTYYYVLYDDNQIQKIYQLIHASKPKKMNFKRSLDRTRTWTSNGFKVGVKILSNAKNLHSGKEAVIALSLPVITATTGFVSSLAINSLDIIGEFGKLLLTKKDILLSVDTFYYDPKGRIKYIKTVKLQKDSHTIETEFFYEKYEDKPLQAIIKDYATGEEKTVKFYPPKQS